MIESQRKPITKEYENKFVPSSDYIMVLNDIIEKRIEERYSRNDIHIKEFSIEGINNTLEYTVASNNLYNKIHLKIVFDKEKGWSVNLNARNKKIAEMLFSDIENYLDVEATSPLNFKKLPTTKFRLKFEDNKSYNEFNNPSFIEKFNNTLPACFSIDIENGELFIFVETERKDDANTAIPLLERELKRCYFLTNTKIEHQYINIEGLASVHLHFEQKIGCYQHFPDNIAPQKWNDNIEIQLNLWSLLDESSDIKIKILILYQILELSEYNFQKYTNPNETPDVLNECRFLRHLVAHGKIKKCGDIEFYLRYLRDNNFISEEIYRSMLNSETATAGLANSKFEKIFNKKVEMIKKQVREKIFEQISKI